MKALSDYDVPSLAAELAAQLSPSPGTPGEGGGEGPSLTRARRILRHFYHGDGSVDWAQVQISRTVQAQIEQHIPQRQSRIAMRTQASDGTLKLLVQMEAGGAVESVLMPGYRADRAAGCLSSQIGCAMGCDFCASTRSGLERNLSAGEIVEQFLHLRAEARALGRRLQTIVFMGMGEPLHNLQSVAQAIRCIAGEGMGHLGGRQITVSTVGIIPGIHELAELGLGVHLAVSLHAADDALRQRIVPTARKYPVADIVAAARQFAQQTRRIVTFEYCLLADVNDSDEQAHKLAELLIGFRAHVNLIPYNAIGPGLSGTVYQRPPDQRMTHFAEILHQRGVVAHFRDRRGDDVSAACGQLRATTL